MTTAKDNETTLLAAVEGGGTSFRVVVFQVNNNQNNRSNNNNKDPPASNDDTSNSVRIRSNEFTIVAQDEFDSSHDKPQQTLQQCVDFFQTHKPLNRRGYGALGVGIFGPVGVNPSQTDTFGTILRSSPKASWRGVDFLTPLKHACQGAMGDPLPVFVETDVNAPALAEYQRVLAKQQQTNPASSISSVAYVTVGTGVGVGLVVNGQTVHGLMHPEGGHVPVQPLPGDTFGGYSWGAKCPFHGHNTVEGLASSVALTERLLQRQGKKRSEASDRSALVSLGDDDEIFDHAANALANLCVTLVLMLSMEKIVLGGGLLNRPVLLEKIRKRTVELLNGYLPITETDKGLSNLIVTSEFGANAGLHGSMVLAQQAHVRSTKTDQNKRIVVDDTPTVQDILDSKERDEKEKEMKRDAFLVGLWHGAIVGALATFALFQWMSRSFGGRRK